MSTRADAPRDRAEELLIKADLREKEEQYQLIFESTSDGLIINDPETGVVEANPAVCRMHGYTYEEFIGLHPTAFIHPDYHGVLEDFVRTIQQGGTYTTRALDLRKDGTAFPIEVHGTTFTYRGKPHILAVVRDITEQVRAYELLEQRVEERTRELQTLLEVSRNVASTLDLDRLLDLILDQLKAVVDYTGAGVSVPDGADVHIIGYRGPGPGTISSGSRMPASRAEPLWQLMRQYEAVIIDDVRADSPTAEIYRKTVGAQLNTAFHYVRSWMSVPMRVKDRDLGSLFLEHSEPYFYTTHHAELALAMAQQAAIAIENARLYEQAQELAALEERQRLARELHDSVSQALFGIRIGTQTARSQLDRDPDKARESIDYVHSLAQGGMAEMRTLLFELRPESLETEGLVAGLRKQVDALTARHEIPIEAVLTGEPDAPVAVKEALYRIAQEALHNSFKHAQPTRVELRLESLEGEIVLTVQDDGVGFDPHGSFPGHLGLRSMEERATRLGGRVDVESAPGAGTRVRARIPYQAGKHDI